MTQIYNKYLINEKLDSKTKRKILSLIDTPPKGKEKLKVNGEDVTFNNKQIEYKEELVELTKYLVDLFDEIKDKELKIEKKGSNVIARIWSKK
jgi:hypothetical protein